MALKTFIARSLMAHLVLFSLLIIVVPCSEGRSKPKLSFLGSLLSQSELFPNRIYTKSEVNQTKNSFVYESPGMRKKWQADRSIKKPGFANNLDVSEKPSYKEVQNIPRAKKLPKKHATLQEIGVSLDTSTQLYWEMNP